MEKQEDRKKGELKERLVFYDHDGGLDDIICLLMLMEMKNIKIIGMAITPGNCFLKMACETCLKILSLYSNTDVEVAKANFYGQNQFPSQWRSYVSILNHFPELINEKINKDQISMLEGPDFLINKVKNAKEKVTILITGPCSNFAAALKKDPSIKDNIDEVVIMGGSIFTGGNVQSYDHDGTAEWNIFYDPEAAKVVLTSGLNIALFSLDSTDKCPLTSQFLNKLGKNKKYEVSCFVSHVLALTQRSMTKHDENFYLWDPITAAYLGEPEMCTLKKVEIDVIVDEPSQGRTIEKKGSGNWIWLADDMKPEVFENYFIELCKKNFDPRE